MENNTLTVMENISPTYTVGGGGVLSSENITLEYFELSTNKETIVVLQGIMKQTSFEKMIDGLNRTEILASKNRFLKTAFKNRTKQYNFSKLNCKLLDKEISDQEYEDEINENAKEYEICIPTAPVKLGELDILTNLVSELKADKLLNDDISVDEVSELFEVNLQDAVNRISKIKLGY